MLIKVKISLENTTNKGIENKPPHVYKVNLKRRTDRWE